MSDKALFKLIQKKMRDREPQAEIDKLIEEYGGLTHYLRDLNEMERRSASQRGDDRPWFWNDDN